MQSTFCSRRVVADIQWNRHIHLGDCTRNHPQVEVNRRKATISTPRGAFKTTHYSWTASQATSNIAATTVVYIRNANDLTQSESGPEMIAAKNRRLLRSKRRNQ